MKYSKYFFVPIILFLLSSCSCEKERKYTAREMWSIAKKVDPNIELVSISNNNPGKRILCKNYGPKCIKGSGRRILVNMVELIVVAFENEAAARTEALRIGQWYAYNWVFDDVRDEPVLEAFVKKAFEAKDAKAQWELKNTHE